MTAPIRRLRMFAGPNGSGKSTIKDLVPERLIGVYINPDEIEREIQGGFLDLAKRGVQADRDEALRFFAESALLAKAGLGSQARAIRWTDGRLDFRGLPVNAYFASVAADFLRRGLMAGGISFTCETVMSSPDKVQLLEDAQRIGYRTYLYYVATEDPGINVSRVRERVRRGGHDVPEGKIVSRYARSLDLLMEAIRRTSRAYVFDNSGDEQLWVAEITDGKSLEMKTEEMPAWFRRAVLHKIAGAEAQG